MISNNCPECKDRKCSYAAKFENLMFCFSRVEGNISVALDEDVYSFALSRSSLHLLEGDVILAIFNIKSKNIVSYFHEYVTDKAILSSFILEIFEEIDHPLAPADIRNIYAEHRIEIRGRK